MRAEATNENSTSSEEITVKNPVVTNIYITTGKITDVKPSKEGGTTKKQLVIDKKIDKGLFGRKYFLCIETKDFPKDSIAKFKISFQSKKKVLSDENTALKIFSDGFDAEYIEILYNNIFNDKSIINNAEFKDKSIVEFIFDRKTDKDRDDYKRLISEATNKCAPLYLKIEEISSEESTVEYNGDTNSEGKKSFYYEKNFNLVEKCFCDREITASELKDLVTLLNNNKEKSLFGWGNCKIEKEDRTYERLAEELNAMFAKYNINTCNRKAHFIAQSYLESGTFGTATEGAEGQNYELKNWENRKKDLETEIKNIDTFKPKIDKIITKYKKTEIDVTKSQVSELTAQITEDLKLTEEERNDVDNYKNIFEKEWKEDFDSSKTCKYQTRASYDSALNGEFANKELKKAGAKQKIENIKNNGNTSLGDGPRYKGKGLIQLTWRNTYVSYFNYLRTKVPIPDSIKGKTIEKILDRSNDDMSQLLASDLYYAIDSAGWFWANYKPYLADAADYDGDTKVKWNKKTIPAIEKITRLINGGTNHLKERTNYYKIIRDNVFRIKSVCVNHDKIK